MTYFNFKAGYNRQGVISFRMGRCDICNKKAPIVYIDGSEGEYGGACVCLKCMKKGVKAALLNNSKRLKQESFLLTPKGLFMKYNADIFNKDIELSYEGFRGRASRVDETSFISEFGFDAEANLNLVEDRFGRTILFSPIRLTKPFRSDGVVYCLLTALHSGEVRIVNFEDFIVAFDKIKEAWKFHHYVALPKNIIGDF